MIKGIWGPAHRSPNKFSHHTMYAIHAYKVIIWTHVLGCIVCFILQTCRTREGGCNGWKLVDYPLHKHPHIFIPKTKCIKKIYVNFLQDGVVLQSDQS